MTRVLLCCAAAALAFGCRSQEDPARGAFTEPKPIAEAAGADDSRRLVDTPETAEAAGEPEAIEEETEEQARSLAAELQAAVGSPTDCLRDYQGSVPTKVRIQISATVRPTGMCIQPSASGPGLSESARRCVEDRVGRVVLKPLDKPLSQTVSTFVEVDYAPPVIVEADPSVSEPVLRNVREPLPPRPEVAPSGRPIMEPTSKPIMEPTSRDPSGPPGKPVSGPKPRPIDGYEVDESSQRWSDK